MLEQIGRDILPKRIEYELYAFPARQFRCRNKVRITGNKNDGVYMTFERERRNIQSDPHIDPFLPEGRHEVAIGEVLDRKASLEKFFLWSGFQNPGAVDVFPDFPEPDSEIPGAA